METLIVDIEADNFLADVTTIWCIGIAEASDPSSVQSYTDHSNEYPNIEAALRRMSAADRIIGHNMIGYDYPVIEKFYPGTLRFEQLYDTMVTGALLDPSRGSHNLSSYGTEMGFPKGDYSDFSQYTQEMVDYMETDVTITGKLYKQQMANLHGATSAGIDYRRSLRMEHNIQLPLSLQMQHGARLDVEACYELESLLRDEADAIKAEVMALHPPRYRPVKADWNFKDRIWEVTSTFTPKGDNARFGYTAGAPLTKVEQVMFNPGSRDQIAQRLSEKYEWMPTKFTSGGAPKMDDDTMLEIEHEEARPLARYLTVVKQLGQLIDGKNGWLKKVTSAGRVHGYVKSCGARTMRMAHSNPNLAQVMKKDKRMRMVWLPDEGQVMVGIDADSLELRELACFLYPWDNGAYAEAVLNGDKADGTDAHSLNMKAAGLASRDGAKTFFYAMIYGALDTKLGAVLVEDYRTAGLPRPSGTLAQIGKKARASLETGIVGLKQLVLAVKAAVKARGCVRLTDGRPVKSSQRIALNSLLQGEGAILMKLALVIFHQDYMEPEYWDQGLRYIFNVHDEVQFSSPPEIADAVGEAFCSCIAQAGEELGHQVPFAGEYKVGANWSETH